jgi:chromosomal replication initiation ATPase DnaA
MRFKLIDIYGISVDRNWFSKLEVIEDEEKNEINIKAPSAFARDWITQNYWNIIEKLAEKGQQKISFC